MKLTAKPFVLRLYLLTGALESVVAFLLLMSIPSDDKNAVLLGYSFQRLLLLSMAFIVFFLFGLIFARISFSDDFLNRTKIFVENALRSLLIRSLLLFFSCVFLFLGGVVFLIPVERLAYFAAYLERLAPVIYLAAGIGLQTLLGQFLWCEQKLNWHVLVEWKKLFLVTGVLFGTLLAFSAWVAWTGIGLTPEISGWHSPGTPILFSQLFLAWLIALPFVFLGNPIGSVFALFQQKRFFFNINPDLIICIGLWLVAFFLWWGEPMRKESYFTPSPTAPNFEYYPYSDAAFYDSTAQNILIGEGQSNRFVLRPLYVFFLAFLHTIGGQQYDSVVFWQTLFLAFTPAFAFLLASLLGGRAAGVLSALLIILRHKNAIALTDVIEVSHSKLLLSDMPMMALMLIVVYVFIHWLGKPHNAPNYLGVMAGALFGLAVLVRSQAQVVILVLLLGMLFSGGFELRKAVQRILFFILGITVMVTPWVLRNNEITGKPAIENNEFYFPVLAGGYTEPTDTVEMLPGESFEEYDQRIRAQIFQYVIDHPVELAQIYASYFIHNEISSIVYLPMSLGLYDLRLYVKHTRFWDSPRITLEADLGIIFFFTLGLVALGISVAFQRMRLLGVIPLFIHLVYSFSTVLARISGWRFILPVDWVIQFYYCIGLIALTVIVISLLINKLPKGILDNKEQIVVPAGKRNHSLLLAFLLCIGISLPLVEILVPERYTDVGREHMIAQNVMNGFLLENGDRVAVSDVRSFLETEPTAVVLYGRALYPLFYEQGDFWGDNNPFSLLVRDLDRLQFTYIGSENALVFIQKDLPPPYFPNASDVLIVGCREDAGIRALAIKVNDSDSYISSSSWQGLTCVSQ